MGLLTTAFLLVHVFQLSIGFHVPSPQMNPWYHPVHQTYYQGFNPQVHIARKPVPTTTTTTTTTTATTTTTSQWSQTDIEELIAKYDPGELHKKFIEWSGVEEIWMVPFLHICNSTNFLKAVAVDLTNPPQVIDPLGSYAFPELCEFYEKNGRMEGQDVDVEKMYFSVGKEHFNELNDYEYNFISMNEMCNFEMYVEGEIEASAKHVCEKSLLDRVKTYIPLPEEELVKFNEYKQELEKNKTQ